MRFRNGRDRGLFLRSVFPAILLIFGVSEISGFAQEVPKQELTPESAARERATGTNTTGGKKASGNSAKVITDAERASMRREDATEIEAAMMPYINNFFATTRLGPEDMITVDVFDQPIYSRNNIVVPPNGKINYPLIGQIMVAGRTTEEIEKEISEKLAEYIIDPKVTVQMVQVHSLKFMVVGEVGNPGIYEMSRRMTLSEGLAKAGYLSKYGNRGKVSLLRMQPSGEPLPMKFDMKQVEEGKSKDIYLAPGDTILVGSNWWKTFDRLVSLTSLLAWMKVLAE
jgi:polysaccharide export outer membrane protein